MGEIGHPRTDDGRDAFELALNAVQERFDGTAEALDEPTLRTKATTLASMRRRIERVGGNVEMLLKQFEEWAEQQDIPDKWSFVFVLHPTVIDRRCRLVFVDVVRTNGDVLLHDRGVATHT